MSIVGKLTEEEVDVLIHHYAVVAGRFDWEQNPNEVVDSRRNADYWRSVKKSPSFELGPR